MIDPAALMFGTLFLAMLIKFAVARCCCGVCSQCTGTTGNGDRKFVLADVANQDCTDCADWNATWVIPPDVHAECNYYLADGNDQPCFLSPFGSGHDPWMEVIYSQNGANTDIDAAIWCIGYPNIQGMETSRYPSSCCAVYTRACCSRWGRD